MSDTVYQLRRVGLPATVTEVKDVMRLTSEVTRFGRHSGNDYFLDSTETLLLVSRWHAEIHRTVNDGNVQYIIRDGSLNGTYVNDVRVKGNHVLKEGDTITFGHKMGRDIEPGQYAPQATSEFRFIFEKATEGDNDEGRALGAGDGTVVLKDVSNNSKRRTNEGLLPLDCLIDAGTAILSSSGRAAVPVAGQQVKRVLAVPPKTVGSMLGGASGSMTVAALSAAGRPKMPPATGMAQRLPTSLTNNKGRASLPAGGQPARKRAAPKHQYSDDDDFDDLQYDDEGSSSKRGKKPKKAAIGGNQLVDSWSYHQEQQRCDFYDCRTPRGDTVSWVQCDDCDKWYHTVCVGCSYEVVRSENAEFHCGCI